jgi:hypothetical protein
MTDKRQTYKVNLYIPGFHYLLARALAAKNQEPVGALLKRLILPQIEEAASSSFRASNALFSAIAKNEISEDLAAELMLHLRANGEVVEESDAPREEV